MNSSMGDPVEDSDCSDAVLRYISQFLMDEDLKDRNLMFQDSVLQAVEKPFLDILSDPPHQNVESQLSHCFSCCNNYGCNSCTAANLVKSSLAPSSYSVRSNFRSNSSSSCNPSSIGSVFTEESSCPSVNTSLQRGSHVIFDFENNRVIPLELKEKTPVAAAELAMGNNKHLAVHDEESEQFEMFDHMLLSIDGNHETLQGGTSGIFHHNGQTKRSNGRIIRRKNRINNRGLVDLRTLLGHCAEAVASNDHRSANELLIQIRQHSTPFGDGSQRLAHCFANALEARMAGTGCEVYAALAAKRMPLTDWLKACRLFITACPFMKTPNLYATQTIMKLAEKANRIHIIHFGILYGFQWPSLIQCLSARPGGPPVLHITGIDFPQPGPHPAAQVEATGRRLANYCERFNVPFQFDAIAQQWDSIRVEDLMNDRNEVTAVYCLYRFRHLLDETISLNSPRNTVLKLITRINPDIFIHGVVNGTYNAPFFVPRFREALFHFSALFDMFEANVTRENLERMVFEEEIYGREILNVVACEGAERVERPETYKQWQVRNVRAGLKQLPLNQEIMSKVMGQVKLHYHKDFLVDEDSQWLLQGWKGRILFALSCWKPA